MKEQKKEISPAFERFLASRQQDPISRLFFETAEGLEDQTKEQVVETQQKIMRASDLLEAALKKILSTEQGRNQLIEEMNKRKGTDH